VGRTVDAGAVGAGAGVDVPDEEMAAWAGTAGGCGTAGLGAHPATMTVVKIKIRVILRIMVVQD
jgi:hypothetical protein